MSPSKADNSAASNPAHFEASGKSKQSLNSDCITTTLTPSGDNDDDSLPLVKMIAIICVFLAESFSINSLYPFIAFMVSDFDVAESEEALGYYTGYIASGFTFSQFIGSPLWGWLSDKPSIGKRTILLCGVMSNCVLILLFGMSSSLPMAIAVRSMNGLMNGNDGVIKVYLRAITTEKNQGQAFGLLAVSWGVGSIAGPLVAGSLSRPALLYPSVFAGTIFDTFPYLLPCICTSFVCLFGFVAGYLFLDEPIESREKEVQDEEIGFSEKEKMSESSPLLAVDGANGKLASLRDMLYRAPVLLSIVTNGMLGLITLMAVETFPLYAKLPVESGGYGFGPSQISFVMSIGGVSLLIWQSGLYALVDKKIGTVRMFQFSIFLVGCTIMCVPLLPSMLRAAFPLAIFWFVTAVVFFVRGCAESSAFTAISILLNNACTSYAGAINGINTSVTSISRAIGPILGGNVFAWSVSKKRTNIFFPFDYHMIWLMLFSLAMVCFVIARHFPKTMGTRSL
eukprot:Nk52_evm25s675 gene=Nk52_evmTU25s675